MNSPQYSVVLLTDTLVLIRDVGPWNIYPTVTNGAEEVVAQIAPWLDGRRLEYYDSEGNRDEILVKDGSFAGFAPLKNP